MENLENQRSHQARHDLHLQGIKEEDKEMAGPRQPPAGTTLPPGDHISKINESDKNPTNEKDRLSKMKSQTNQKSRQKGHNDAEN